MERLYEEIAGKLEQQIVKGALRPGDKVPSLRKMSERHGVSISTVLQAYMALEGRGVIEARPQSGYYVKPSPEATLHMPSMTAPSLQQKTVGVSDLVMRVIDGESKPGVVALAAASPGAELFPTAALARLIHQVARRDGPDIHRYSMPPGDPELRRQVSRRAFGLGLTLDPDEIVITTGCMEALNLAVRALAGPGDCVVVESPTYYGILQVLENLGIKAVEVSTDPREGMCLNVLEKILEKHSVKAIMAMPNFHNPMGSLMPEEKKKELYKLIQKYDVPLIEDDIYGELQYRGDRPGVIKRYDKKGLVMLCSSYSKSISPGFRVGWLASGRYTEAIRNLKFMSTIATSTLHQRVVAEFIKTGAFDRHLRTFRKTLEGQMIQAQAVLSESFPKGTLVTRPEGGYVIWMELPGSVDTIKLHAEALKQGVSFAPGSLFSAARGYRNALRVNCGVKWTPQVEYALRKLGDLASR